MRPQQAQLEKKTYFWHNPRTNHIFQGAPPQYDSLRPDGYVTVECKSAHETELWSERLRKQDEQWSQANAYEREIVEGRMREDLRREIRQKLSRLQRDSQNPALNAALLNHALQMLDEQEKKGQFLRESWLHREGYEEGKDGH